MCNFYYKLRAYLLMMTFKLCLWVWRRRKRWFFVFFWAYRKSLPCIYPPGTVSFRLSDKNGAFYTSFGKPPPIPLCWCWLHFIFLYSPNLRSPISSTLPQISMAGCSIRALWILNNFDSVVFSRFSTKLRIDCFILRSFLGFSLSVSISYLSCKENKNIGYVMFKKEVAFGSVLWNKRSRWIEIKIWVLIILGLQIFFVFYSWMLTILD